MSKKKLIILQVRKFDPLIVATQLSGIEFIKQREVIPPTKEISKSDITCNRSHATKFRK